MVSLSTIPCPVTYMRSFLKFLSCSADFSLCPLLLLTIHPLKNPVLLTCGFSHLPCPLCLTYSVTCRARFAPTQVPTLGVATGVPSSVHWKSFPLKMINELLKFTKLSIKHS